MLQIRNEGINLSDILEGKVNIDRYHSLLIFRFHNENCMPCVNKQISYLKYFASKFKKEKILIIAGLTNDKEFKKFAEEFDQISAINLQQGLLPLDSIYEPYFFILDSNLKMRRLFIPSSLDSSLTIDYLDANIKVIY
jgi:hypothetical protein